MEGDERKWRRRTASQWRRLLERQAQSGQSVEAFCRDRSISPGSLYRWRRQLSGEPAAIAAAAQSAPAEPAFVDLGALGVGGSGGDRGWELELSLGGGVVLRLRGG
jgi:hypothetical protein